MQLNMYRASSCPSSGATTTAVAASGLHIAIRDNCSVNLQLQTDKRYCFATFYSYHWANTVILLSVVKRSKILIYN